jgi:hypothetical protein
MMTLTDIINTAPGNWIQDDFNAIPTGLQQKTGKSGPFYVGKIQDPQFPGVQADVTFFRPDAMQFQDKVCHFAGQGMKRDEYNGTPKVTIGQKVTIQVMGTPQLPQHSPQQAQGYQQTPAQPYHHQPAQQPAPAQAQKKPILGVTVGMAINNACNLIAAVGTCGRPLQEEIHNLASDIIRIGIALESGNLAPLARNREGHPQQREAPFPQPPPPEQVNQADTEDEDVPF